MRRRGGKSKWWWRVLLLALPPLLFALVFRRQLTWRPDVLTTLRGRTVLWMRYTPDGQYLAVVSNEVPTITNANAVRAGESNNWEGAAELSLIRIAYGKQLWSKSEIETPCVMLPDGRVMTSGETLQIFNVRGEKVMDERDGSEVLAAGRQLLAQSDNGRPITVWDSSKPPDDPGEQRTFGHDSWVNALAFSPDGRTLASDDFAVMRSGGRTPTPNFQMYVVRLWDVRTGRLKTLQHPITFSATAGQSQILSLLFSPDGQQLAVVRVASVDLFNARTGQALWKKAHSNLSNVAFSPDGRWLATTTGDAVRLWNAGTGAAGRVLKNARLQSHTETAFAFSPDGRDMAVGSNDGVITLWRLR